MRVKYIADLHLYDISSIDWRPSFSGLDEYAEHLCESWNAFTEKDDTIIIVGDVGTYCERTLKVLKALKGNLVLVKGNHDLTWGNNVYSCGVFQGVYDELISDDLVIQHLPTEGTNSVNKFFIHGHHHRYDTPGMQNKLAKYVTDVYRYNCAADLNNNKPCTLQDLMLNKEVMIESYVARGLLRRI